MNAFKQQCIELRKKDYTLREIMQITGRPKTSVYGHIRNVPLSADKRGSIRAAWRERAIKNADKRRGKSLRAYKQFSIWSISLVSLVSHLLFDGQLDRRGCAYNNRSISLLKHTEKCMQEIYEYEPSRYLNITTGVHRISYHNVALAAYLQDKSSELLQRVDSMERKLQREFVRAFFDDEGCIDFRKARNVRQIRGYQKNTEILQLVQKILTHFRIDSKIALPNEVVISGKENLIKFQKEINFSPGVSINGNRSNSIWKKSYEKRELLHMALVSYRA